MTFAPEFPPADPTLRPTRATSSEREGARCSSGYGASFRALSGGSTPLDGAQASTHLAHAFQTVTGSPPSAATLDLLWAQWALETARGQAMYGNNFGGIKARGHASGANFVTTEGSGSHRRRVVERFRTYATPEEGARDYVRLLARRFPDAFEAARVGDLDGFAKGLARAGYFTARPETYRRGLERLAEEHATGAVAAIPQNSVVEFLTEGVRHWLSRRLDRDE